MPEIDSLNPLSCPVLNKEQAVVQTIPNNTTWTPIVCPDSPVAYAGPGASSISSASANSVLAAPGIYLLAGQLMLGSNATGRRIVGFEFTAALDPATVGTSVDRCETGPAANWCGSVSTMRAWVLASSYVRMVGIQAITTPAGATLNTQITTTTNSRSRYFIARLDYYNY